jgi:SagB-type dehydrogenase family enzyme
MAREVTEMRHSLVLLSILAFLALGAAVGAPARAQESLILETIELPAPVLAGTMSLEETLSQRRSFRSFEKDEPLSLEEIGQLFWAAQGMTGPGKRTAPSAGARYPLEIYAATRGGLYHYRPEDHSAMLSRRGALLDSIFQAAGANKESLRDAPAVFIIAGIVARTEGRYGSRALRYVTLEAGHAAQNLLLQAVALGLGAVPIGAYDDEKVRRALDLPEDQTPLYLIPVGHPAGL